MVYPSLGLKSPAFLKKDVDFSLPSGGITELASPLGCGKTEWLLRILSVRTEVRVAWIEPGAKFSDSSFPTAFPEYGVALERVLFVECGKELLWTAHQILKSQIFQVVVLKGCAGTRPLLDEMDFRRLQLLAEKAQVAVVLLNEKRTVRGAWPIAAQIEIARPEVTTGLLDYEVERLIPEFQITKQRHGTSASIGGIAAIPSWGQKAWQKLGLLPTG